MEARKSVIVAVVGLLVVTSAACRKKVPVAAAPSVPAPVAHEPAPPRAPTIGEFGVDPNPIERGQSATLRWQVRDATQIHIDQGIGTIPERGRRNITPEVSTTYTLTATGPGGSTTAAATLNVTAPPPPVPPQVTTAAPTLAERLKNEVSDVYFDFDKYYLREDARAALEKDAQALKLILNDFPTTTVVLEGHCDERGSAEYNLGLGDRRASSVKEFLHALGLPGPRLVTVSYGKEHPQCMDSNETCWQLNRRVHFAPGETQRVMTKSEELR